MEAEQERWLYRYVSKGLGEMTWEPILQLTPDEYESVSAALRLIETVFEGTAAYAKIVRADLDAYAASLRLKLAERDQLRQTQAWLPELRYRFIAASAAIRMHEEPNIGFANRSLPPLDVERVKNEFRATYDSSLAYRIIYILRNLLVHGASTVLRAVAKVRIDENGEHLADVSLRLDRDAFSRSGAKSAVRKEVASLKEDPDLLVMADSALDEVQTMQAKLHRLLYPDHNFAVDLIHRYIVIAHEAGGGGPHFHMHDPGQPFQNMTTLHMTEAIFNYVLQEIGSRKSAVALE